MGENDSIFRVPFIYSRQAVGRGALVGGWLTDSHETNDTQLYGGRERVVISGPDEFLHFFLAPFNLSPSLLVDFEKCRGKSPKFEENHYLDSFAR